MFSPSLDAFRIWKERAGASNAKCVLLSLVLCKQPSERNQHKGARVHPSLGTLGRVTGWDVWPLVLWASSARPNKAETAGAVWAVLSH